MLPMITRKKCFAMLLSQTQRTTQNRGLHKKISLYLKKHKNCSHLNGNGSLLFRCSAYGHYVLGGVSGGLHLNQNLSSSECLS